MMCCATASFYSVWFIFMLLSGANETKSIPNTYFNTWGRFTGGDSWGMDHSPSVMFRVMCLSKKYLKLVAVVHRHGSRQSILRSMAWGPLC